MMRLGWGSLLWLMIAFALFLSIVHPVKAITTIDLRTDPSGNPTPFDNRSPVIILDFMYENPDDKVTILDHRLVLNDGKTIPPTLSYPPALPQFNTRNEQPSGIDRWIFYYEKDRNIALADNDYYLWVRSKDENDNYQETGIIFTVDASEMKITVLSPEDPLVSSDFRVSTTARGKKFYFNISHDPSFTHVEGCRYSVDKTVPTISDEEEYQEALREAYSTGQSMTKRPGVAGNNEYYVDISLPYSYQENQGKDYMVTCLESEKYHAKDFRLAFDGTSPTIEASFYPSTVADKNDLSAELTINTDDRTNCSIKNTDLQCNKISDEDCPTDLGNYYYEWPAGYFKTETLDDYYSDDRPPEHLGFLGAWKDAAKTVREPMITDENEYIYTFDITCSNYAGRTTTDQQVLTIRPTDTLKIWNVTGYWAPGTVFDYVIQTNIAPRTGSCYASIGDAETPVPIVYDLSDQMSETSTKNQFVRHFNVGSEGKYWVNVSCDRGGETYIENFTVEIDTHPPETPEIIFDSEPICGGSTISFTLSATDSGSGIEGFDYSITGPGGEELSSGHEPADGSGSVHISKNIGMVEDQQYTVSVTAYDLSGQTRSSSDKIYYRATSHVDCDFTPPTGELVTEPFTGGLRVNVTCKDNDGGSGCENYYEYVSDISPIDCEDENLQWKTRQYSQGMMEFDQTTYFCWKVKDLGGNTQASDMETIRAGIGIMLEQPTFGVSPEKNFYLEISTMLDADCKQARWDSYIDSNSDSPITIYNYMASSPNNDFDTTGGTRHIINEFDGVARQIGAGDENEEYWAIVCKTPDEIYNLAGLNLAYDTTPPILTMDFDPKEIHTTPTQSNMTLFSDHDEMICSYTNYESETYDFGADAAERSDYKTLFWAQQPGETEFFPQSQEPETYHYSATCTNLAGLSSSTEGDLTVNFQTQLAVNIEMEDLYEDPSVPILALTYLDAICDYSFDEGMTENPLNKRSNVGSDDHYEHTATPTLEDGDYQLQVDCVGEEYAGQDEHQFTVDTRPPTTPEITAEDYVCTGEPLMISYHSEDPGTGVERYDYELKDNDDGAITADTTTEETITITEGLVPGQRYTFTVNATDKLGKTSEKGRKTVEILGLDDARCDFTPPNGRSDPVTYSNGVFVDMYCEDAGTGCANSFKYSIISPLEECNYDDLPETATYSSVTGNYNTATNPLFFTTSQRLCWQVIDGAGLTDEGYEDIVAGIGLKQELPTMGISPTKWFRLEFSTLLDSECRMGDWLSAFDSMDNYQDIFENLQPSTFEFTNGKTHIIYNYTDMAGYPYEETTKPIAVACKHDNADGSIYTAMKKTIGYDTTPPTLESKIIPGFIYEPPKEAYLSFTTDDPSMCNYTDHEGNPHYFESLSDPNPEDEDSYIEDYETTRIPPSGGFFPGSKGTFTYKIICLNKAGMTSTTQSTVNMDLKDPNELPITITTPNTIRSRQGYMTAETFVEADCEYRIDEEEFRPMTSERTDSGIYNHSAQHTFSTDGNHVLSVTCRRASNELVQNSESKNILVDSQPPTTPELSTQDYLCPNTPLTASFHSEDEGSGIDRYNYTLIRDDGEIIETDTTTEESITAVVTLYPERTYTLEVTAYDGVGNPSTPARQNIYAAPGDDIRCDVTSPISKIRNEVVAEGIHTYIRCADSESGCDHYEFAHSPEPIDCNDDSVYAGNSGSFKEITDPTYTHESSNYILFTQTETLCWRAYDVGGNFYQGEETIRGGIGIEIEQPLLGIAPTENFDLLITTVIPAQCRQGAWIPEYDSYDDDVTRSQAIYNSLIDPRNQFETTGGLEHSMHFTAFSGSGENYEQYWVISCEANGIYNYRMIELGYDTTPPIVNSWTEPPVMYRSPSESRLFAETNEGAVCEYTYVNQGTNHYFNDEEADYERKDNYVNSYDTRLPSENPIEFFTEDDTTYYYDVTCTNMAGLSATVRTNTTLNLQSDLLIDVNMEDTYSDSSFYINATTYLDATCTYEFTQSNGDLQRSSRAGAFDHTSLQTGVPDGYYDVMITCETDIPERMTNTVVHSFLVDANPPVPPVIDIIPQITCQLENPPIMSLTATDASGIDHYGYRILLPDGNYEEGTTTEDTLEVPIDTPMEDGFTYEIQAYAVDGVGSDSGWGDIFTFLATTNNHPACDNTAPNGGVTTTVVSNGMTATVTCTDSQSGCTDLYLYSIVDPLDSCEGATFSTRTYDQDEDNPLLFQETKKLCWNVSDIAGNTAAGEETISATIGIELTEPSFGLASDRTFDLTVNTRRDAICRIGTKSSYGMFTDPQTLYANMAGNDFPITGGSSHRFEPFTDFQSSTQEEQTSDYLVACNAQGQYDVLPITIGYDRTNPVIETTADPDPIYREPPFTTLTAKTDDESICFYVDETEGSGTRTYFFDPQPDYFQEEDYAEEHVSRLPGEASVYQENGEYTYMINCTNLAGRVSTAPYTVRVDLQDDLQVMLNLESIYTEPVREITATTYLPATCQLSIDGEQLGQMTSTEDAGVFIHTARSIPALDEGDHDVTVFCTTDEPPIMQGQDHGSFTLDTLAPEILEVTAVPDPTCSLTTVPRISVDASDTGTGISTYHYIVKTPTGDYETETDQPSITPEITVPLQNDFTYEVEVYVSDNAQHTSPAAQTSFLATNPDHILCDHIPPQGGVDKTVTPDAVFATITCADAESGCSNSIKYARIDSLQTCEDDAIDYVTGTLGQQLEFTDTERLCWMVFDNAGNEDTGDELVAAGVGVELKEPEFGYAPDRTFRFEVTTMQNAECRQGAWLEGVYNSYSDVQLFNSLYENTFDVTGLTSHVVPTFDDFAIFSADDEYEQEWVVSCNANGRFDSIRFNLGFDTTGADINATATPDVIYEPPKETHLTLETDDEALCTYTDYNDNQKDFGNTDIHDRNAYQSFYETRLPEDPNQYFSGSQGTMTYEFTCTNLAGIETTDTTTVTLDIQDELSITIDMDDTYTTNDVDVVAETLINAECTYQMDGGDQLELSSSKKLFGGYKHTASTTLEDGTHTITVECFAQSPSPMMNVESKNILVDATPPPPPIIVIEPNPTCQLEQAPNMTLTSEDESGIAQYNYEISMPDGETIEGETTFGLVQLPITLEQDQTYSVRATATDNAGHRSAQSDTFTFLATDANHPDCDHAPPVGGVSEEVVSTGINVIVTCTDGQSGCSNNYEFARIDPLETCDSASYNSGTLGETIFFEDTERLCWRVSDKAGNIDSGDQIIAAGLGIQLVNPTFGVAGEKQFEFKVVTQKSAECRQGAWDLYKDAASDQELYVIMGDSNQFSTDDGLTHTINPFRAFRDSQPDTYSREWVVVCNANGRYDAIRFTLGYDTTPPQLDINANPNPIYSPPTYTTISLTSDEDVMCTYENHEGEFQHFYNPESPDETNRDQYNNNYQVRVPEDGTIFQDTHETYSYEFTCTNLAGLERTMSYDVIVDLQDNLDITIDMPSLYGSALMEVNATTLIPATCTYAIDGEQLGQMSTEERSDKYYHTGTSIPPLEDGQHTIVVDCLAELQESMAGRETHTIIIDTHAPETPVVSALPDPTCSLTDLPLISVVTSDASDIVAYHYTITLPDGNDIVSSTTDPEFYAPIPRPMEEAEYQVSVSAEDEFGHTSQSGTTTFLATSADHPMCDFNPPSTSYQTTTSASGLDVIITCEDGESGCEDNYMLYETPDTFSECPSDETAYHSEPLGASLHYEETTKICWIVEDKAHNTATGSANIRASVGIEIQEPSFGIAKTKTFPLVVTTELDATCKQASWEPTNYGNKGAKEVYDAIPSTGLFENTGGTIHNITMFTSLSQAPGDTYSKSWVIACNANGRYDMLITDLGYDRTPPELIITSSPNPIYLAPYETQLYIDSDEDVFCEYFDYENYYHHFYGDTPDKTDPDYYRSSYQSRLPQNPEEYYPDITRTEYTYNVTCTNKAGWKTQQYHTVVLDPQQDLVMSFSMDDHYTQTPIEIRATTLLPADCTYYLNNKTGPISSGSMTRQPAGSEYEHTTTVSPPDGELEVTVYCLYEEGEPKSSSERERTILDTQDPTQPIVNATPNPTCSLTEAPLIMLQSSDSGSGVSRFEYTIEQPRGSDITGSTTSTIFQPELDTPMREGGTYTVNVVAYDSYEHASEAGQGQFIAMGENSPVCDKNPPTATVQQTVVSDGIEFSVVCNDAESGCDDAYRYALIDPEMPCSSADYSSREYDDDPYLVEDTKKLCWIVNDNAQPTPNNASGEAIIAAGVYITIDEPRFGVSPTKTFTLKASTQKAATCRQGIWQQNFEGMSDEQVYNFLEANTDTTFDMTGSTEHIINNFDRLSSQSNNEYSTTWVIACNAAGRYSAQAFDLGYDLTPPVIEATANPNPMQEPIDLSTMLSVETDDEAICTYVDYNHEAHNFYGEEPDFDNKEYYQTSYQTRLPEDPNQYFQAASYTEYPYTITCTNLAGLKTESGLSVIVDPVNSLSVSILTSRQQSQQSVLINASTLIGSKCDYSTDGLQSQPMTTQDNLYHEDTKELPEGKHTLLVACTSIYDELLSGQAMTNLYVDFQPPSVPNVSVTSPTCSLEDTVVVRMRSTDEISGIDHYEYELQLPDGEVMDGTSSAEVFELPMDTPLQNDAEYQLKGRAVDKAGHKSAWSDTATIRATHATHPDCDKTSPTGWVTIKDTPNGAELTVHCHDEESGCTDRYGFAVLPQGSSCEGVSYTSRSYDEIVSVTDDQMLCWQVSDLGGNTDEGWEDVSVSLQIELVEPTFGISAEQTHRLMFKTSRSADCRMGFINPTHPDNLEDWYGQLGETFDMTGQSQHVIENFNLVSFGATSCQGRAECEQPVVLICTENSRYHYSLFTLGYDTSAPSLQTRISPDPVIEPQNLQATLYATSDDDVWCRYIETDSGTSYGFYQYPDITNPSQYSPEHEKNLGYFSPPSNGEGSYDVTYNVTCVNLAGRETSKLETVTISPKNEVTITINNPAEYESRTINIDVATDLAANCEYKFNPNHPGIPFTTTGLTRHTTTHTFDEDGDYTLIVSCEATSGPYMSSTTKNIVVDSTGPEMLEIITNDQTCSLSTLSATLVGNAEVIGLKGYEYQILDGSNYEVIPWKEVSSHGSERVSESLSMIAGQTYTWQVVAVDEFDRKSTILSKTVQAQDNTYPTCDFDDPIGSMRLEEFYGGVNAYVECQDDGTGCSQYYGYVFNPLFSGQQSCTGDYVSYSYESERPRLIEESGRACYQVYDMAANTALGSKDVVILDFCANGIQDPEEEGIDCGGACPTDCYTCSNGVWDPEEEGVDCGGVCAEPCEQTCGDGFVDSGEECDGGVNGLTCEDFGLLSGKVTCSDDCTIDTSTCMPPPKGTCGDGKLDSGEECDGGVNGLTCEALGLGAGSLSCSSTCSIITSGCGGEENYCGDGSVGIGESCDSGVNGLTCSDFGFLGGNLFCDDSCSFSTSGCIADYCGDGVLDNGEECDSSLPDLTCEDFGMISGSLSCSNTCDVSTASCEGVSSTCGDGFIGTGESCDGSVQGLTCEDFGLTSGELTCNDQCQITTENCLQSDCGNGVIDRGESCDGLDWGGITSCKDLSTDFVSGMPECKPNCHFDTETCIMREKPGEEQDFVYCTKNSDCLDAQICMEGYCVDDLSKPQVDGQDDVDGDGLPDWWEEEYFGCTDCASATEDVDGDGYTNIEEYRRSTHPLIKDDNPDYQKKKQAMWFLIIGLVMLILGGGYLVTDAFIIPFFVGTALPYYDEELKPKVMKLLGKEEILPKKGILGVAQGSQAQRSTVQKPKGPSPEEILRMKILAERKKREEMQNRIKELHQKEKDKKRKNLLSSFETAPKDNKGSSALKGVAGGTKSTSLSKSKTLRISQEDRLEERLSELKSEPKPVKDPFEDKKIMKTSEPKKPLIKNSLVFDELEKIVKSEPSKEDDADVFSKLEKLERGKARNDDVFGALSTITGTSKSSVRKTMTNNPTLTHMKKMFSEADKKDVTPKRLTPVLKHLLAKKHISRSTANKTLDHLASREILTERQKQKILKDLKDLTDKKLEAKIGKKKGST